MKLAELQEIMGRQATEDKKQKYVNATAPTMQEALAKAAVELGVPVQRIAFEIVQKGELGMMGVGKKDFVIMAYAIKDPSALQSEDLGDMDFGFDTNANRDGKIFVRKTSNAVLIKVIAPIGNGQAVSEHVALAAVQHKTQENINSGMVSKAVKRQDEEWIKVAVLDEYNPNEDARIEVETTDMEMKAWVTLTRPGRNGADVSTEQIRAALSSNLVVEGFLPDAILALEENPSYGEPVLVAEGNRPQNGEDAKVVYSFETSRKVKIKEMEGGRVDFKELNTINNVVEGQVLAKLLAPKRGEPGLTVTGKMLPAKDGKQKDLVVGNNVRLSEDKKQAIANANGQVILSGEKISVEPILTIEGNVNMKNGGNIVFLGSVNVKGNVEDGFSIKAAGNIEVNGTIEKCEIDCEGDIIVHSGITGKGGALIKSGGNIWAKFIENANVEAGGLVIVSEGIVNSTIACDHKVICRGKRASIVGGSIKACEEIDAKNLGSVAGVETILEVGFDPKLKASLEACLESIKLIQKEETEVMLNLATLDKLFKAKKDQPKEKKDYFDNLKKHSMELKKSLKEKQEELTQFQQQINELKTLGKISSSGKVYPGVKIQIRDSYLDVRNEYRAVSFISEHNIVKITKYVESDEDISLNKGNKR